MLPFSFTLTQACASSEERRLTSGWAQAPRGVRTTSSAENTEAPGLGRLRSFGLPGALSGPPASFSVSFGRCPSGTRQGAGTWCQLQPGAESAPQQQAVGTSVCAVFPAVLGRGHLDRGQRRGGGRHRELLTSAVRRQKSSEVCAVLWEYLLFVKWHHSLQWYPQVRKTPESSKRDSWWGSVQFSHSVAQSCPTLCDPMNRSTPGLPVHHQLLEFTQTHAHRMGDAIQHLIICRPFLLLPHVLPRIGLFQ